MQPATYELLPILRAATKTKRFEMRRSVRRLGSLALVFISAWLWPGAAAQEPEDRKAEKPKPTGVATGAPHAPVKDAMSRPITAGGVVGAAPTPFYHTHRENKPPNSPSPVHSLIALFL